MQAFVHLIIRNSYLKTSRRERRRRPSEFSHLLLDLLSVALSETRPGSPLFKLFRRGGERRERGERGEVMTGQVWNLHTLLVVHSVGVMSHSYCSGRPGECW